MIETDTRWKSSFFSGLLRRNLSSVKTTTLPPLTRFLKKGDFASIYELLNNRSVDTTRWFEEEYSILGENCLHLILKFQPPAKIVELVLQQLVEYGVPEPELSVDVLGRTPLHHAVGFLCDPSVVQVLLRSPSGRLSVRAQDAEGRLPLHIAMRPYELWNAHKKRKMKDRQQQHDAPDLGARLKTTVELLVNVCPQTALAVDDKKRTPLQYIQVLEADNLFRSSMPAISEGLRVAEDVSKAMIRKRYPTSGMMVEIPTNSSESDDDISVLSWQW